jgi:hypothetical protein
MTLTLPGLQSNSLKTFMAKTRHDMQRAANDGTKQSRCKMKRGACAVCALWMNAQGWTTPYAFPDSSSC